MSGAGTTKLPPLDFLALTQSTRAKNQPIVKFAPKDMAMASIADFLSEIESRALKVIRREGYQVLKGNQFRAIANPNKLATTLRGVACNAKSALSHSQQVRDCLNNSDIDGAVLAAIRAMNELWTAEGGDALTQNARSGGKERVRRDKDGKQAAKAMAKKLWLERRDGLHPRLKANEQFATEVMHRWPILTSSKVICGWCTDWNKQVKKTKKNQPSSSLAIVQDRG